MCKSEKDNARGKQTIIWVVRQYKWLTDSIKIERQRQKLTDSVKDNVKVNRKYQRLTDNANS